MKGFLTSDKRQRAAIMVGIIEELRQRETRKQIVIKFIHEPYFVRQGISVSKMKMTKKIRHC